MLKSMRLLMLGALLTGCVSATRGAIDSAICDGTRKARADHAAALVEDGGPLSLVTGAALIMQIDAGCARR